MRLDNSTKIANTRKAPTFKPWMAALACTIILTGTVPTSAFAHGFGRQAGQASGPTVTEKYPDGTTKTTQETNPDSNGNQVTTTSHYGEDGVKTGDEQNTYGLKPNDKLIIKRRVRKWKADPQTHQPTQETTDYFTVEDGAVTGGTRTDLSRDDNGNDTNIDSYIWQVDPKEPGGGHWNKTSNTPLKMTGGLLQTTIQTKLGAIMVNLPSDMMASDSITGTVIAQPAGKTQKEQEQNASELNGYVVSLEGQKATPGEMVGKWLIPAAAGGAIALMVFDKHGHQVAETHVPLQTDAPPLPVKTTPPTESDFHMPTIGQVGKPITMTGPFTGDSAKTNVYLGGKAIPVLAESPREAVAVAHGGAGLSTLKLQEQSVTVEQPYRQIGCGLSTAKTAMQIGETEPLKLTVTGLAGLTSPIAVVLQNYSPNVVGIQGGDTQTIQAAPGDVSSDGTFTKSMTLTSRGLGGFSIGAHLDETQAVQVDDGKKTGLSDGEIKKAKEVIKKLIPGEETPTEIKENAAVNAITDANSKKDDALRTQERKKGTPEQKQKEKDAKDAQDAADAATKDLTDAEKKDVYKKLAESYKRSADDDRKIRDEAIQKAKDLRAQADKTTDPDEKQNLQSQADDQDRIQDNRIQQLKEDSAHQTEYENKAK